MSNRNGTALTLAVGAFFAGALACGPSMEPERVMTPEERLQQEEQKAYEAELERKKRGDTSDIEIEPEQAELFDKKGAEMELKRASLSASTCPDVVEGKHPKGVAEVSITFASDGSVKSASVAPPFDGDLKECILTAYQAVIIEPFREPEATVPWKLDLTGKKKKK